MISNSQLEKIKDYLNEQEIAVLEKVYKRVEFEDHFFKTKSELKWFYPLKILDYFDTKNAPGPKAADEEGYFAIPQWKVLPYLERVSEQVKTPGNESYIDELLSIIINISNYKDASGKHIDNYRTWYYFVKILLNIPNGRIPNEIINLIPIWLDSKFDTSLPGAEIATKLLSKFLDSENSEDWEKAEKLIEFITDIKFASAEEIFRKRKRAETIIDPHWILKTFEVNVPNVAQKCSENIVFHLADKLKEIFRRERQEHSIDITCEHVEDTYRITALHSKDSKFEISIGLIKEEDLKAEKPEERFIKKLNAKPYELFNFELDNCKNKVSFIIETKNMILEELKFLDASELNERLSFLYQDIFDDYSYIWLKSVFYDPGIGANDAKETLTIILRDIIREKAKINKESVEKIFLEFESENYQYPLFKRISLFVIGSEWESYKDIFWRMVEEDTESVLFNNPYFEPEIYKILEDNIEKFLPEEKEKTKAIIERGPQERLNIPESEKDKFIAYWKQTWYSSIKSDPLFCPIYEKLKLITQSEEEIAFKEADVKTGFGEPPLSKEDFFKMSNDELAKYLNSFKTKDIWKGPSIEGLAESLRAVVKENPEKFIEEIDAFLTVGYLYIHEILWGIKEAWTAKKNIDWSRLFSFFHKYLDRDGFWDEKFIVKTKFLTSNHYAITGIIGELIQEGTRDDSWAFSEDYFQSAKEIIFKILEKEKSQEAMGDAVTHALNSSLGKIITALILLSLRIARVEDKKATKKDTKWDLDLKEKYDKALADGINESYTLLGEYLSNFHYLGKVWTESNINRISISEDENIWEAFMEGYLFRSTFRSYLYALMKPHYVASLNHNFKEEHANEGLIEHIAIAYLRGLENLSEDSLFRKLIDAQKHEQLEKIISLFWMQRNYFVKEPEAEVPEAEPDQIENIRKRIIEFWKFLYEKHKDKDPLYDDDKRIISDVSKLTVFLLKIDAENFEWLMLSAQYVHINFNSPFFIEYLDRLKDKEDKIQSGRYIGKIYLTMLDAFTPDYDQKHIRSIVEYLYDLKDKEARESANEICNIYGRRGSEFLRDIYEKNKNIEYDD